MNQHPVPQNVASYQFRLVGDMTLKQFGLLSSGVVAGFLIYQLPLHPTFKWPLIFFSAFFGFALAFVPVEDRPLDRWLAALLKSIYSPTQFFWKKHPVLPDYLQPSSARPRLPDSQVPPQPPKDRRQLTAYLQTLSSPQPLSELDQHELSLLDHITQLFHSFKPPHVSVTPLPPSPLDEPKLPQVRVRSLAGFNPPLRGEVRVADSSPVAPSKAKGAKGEAANAPTDPLVEFKPLLFSKKDFSRLPSAASFSPPGPTTAATSTRLPFPAPPEKPNLIVGMVVDKYDRILDNAIIEIRDTDHRPLRAVKTNRLGQFFTATPLPNGAYELVVEKDGYNFAILTLKLTGDIVAPLEIRALNEGQTPFK